MGAPTEPSDNANNLSCHDLGGGNIAAIGVRSPKEGVEIRTTTIGTLNRFVGGSTLKMIGAPPLETSVESARIGENSAAGAAAKIGQQDLRSCLTKIGQSL